MARLQTPAIPAKMYRHFAVVTLLLTASVAFFADGENREAVAAQVAEKKQETKVRRESYARFGAPKLGGQQAATVGRFSEDDGGADLAFGTPTAGPSLVGNRGTDAGSDDPLVRAGYPRAYLEGLSPEERHKLLESLLATEGERRSQAAALAAASARRAGAPVGVD